MSPPRLETPSVVPGRFSALRAALGHRALVLSAGLVLLSLCLLSLADVLSPRGDASRETLQAREAVVELLSTRLSLLASATGHATVQAAVQRFVAETPSVTAATLRRAGAPEPVVFGNSDAFASAPARVVVAVLDGGRRWGEVEIAFAPVGSFAEDAIYYGALATALLLAFFAYLGKALLQLDPSRAIPERVDNAFNLLVEGVIVVDENGRVLMVNDAAAAMAGRGRAELVGSSLEAWQWLRDRRWQSPWATVLRTGLSIIDHPVALHARADDTDSEQGVRTVNYALNCSLIRAEGGRPAGVMVTLTDLSAMERKNRELSGALTRLRRSQESITLKNRELEALASQDPLTGLKNRRAIVEELRVRLDARGPESVGLACVMVDIDHFKRINDTLGHAAGDEVICAVANTLSAHCREGDSAARIGGEEFVVVLPDTGLEAAMVIAERIRLGIERLADAVTVPVDALSASLGVAPRDADVETLEQLLDRADRALYAAKRGGRNRVVGFDPVLFQGDDASQQATGADDSSADATLELQRRLEAASGELDALKRFDPDTGLPRRDVFVERLQQSIAGAQRSGRNPTVLSVALRDAARFESSLGRAGIVELLSHFTERLAGGLRRGDAVAEVLEGHALCHLGNVEFGVLLEGVDDASVQRIAGRLQGLFADPILVDGTRVHVETGIGVAHHPADGDTAERVIEHALESRHAVSAWSRKTSEEAPGELRASSRELLELESDLHEAIAAGGLEVHYQPKLELVSRRIVGVEALVRWHHAKRGQVSPAEFIPLAERSGLIEDISTFVTERSLAELAGWHRAGFDELSLAINVSAAQLRHPELVGDVLGALDAAGVAPEYVEVELTETAVIESPQRARIALGQLRGAGVSVSMDDFGTGYTSLALLADLPLDSVKIDRSFVDAMSGNARSRAIVRSMVDMGRALGLSVIGEGVETNEQLELLTAFGCDLVQGYLISRPLNATALVELLERQARQLEPRRRA